jgi:hypothetical protein
MNKNSYLTMIILLPITTIQTISIMPRKDLTTYTSVDLDIRRDGYSTSEAIIGVGVVANGDYTDVSFSSSSLIEGSTYFLEITADSELVYRDKIYSTVQADFKVKHIVSQTSYTSSTSGDNTYIV